MAREHDCGRSVSCVVPMISVCCVCGKELASYYVCSWGRPTCNRCDDRVAFSSAWGLMPVIALLMLLPLVPVDGELLNPPRCISVNGRILRVERDVGFTPYQTVWSDTGEQGPRWNLRGDGYWDRVVPCP